MLHWIMSHSVCLPARFKRSITFTNTTSLRDTGHLRRRRGRRQSAPHLGGGQWLEGFHEAPGREAEVVVHADLMHALRQLRCTRLALAAGAPREQRSLAGGTLQRGRVRCSCLLRSAIP